MVMGSDIDGRQMKGKSESEFTYKLSWPFVYVTDELRR